MYYTKKKWQGNNIMDKWNKWGTNILDGSITPHRNIIYVHSGSKNSHPGFLNKWVYSHTLSDIQKRYVHLDK